MYRVAITTNKSRIEAQNFSTEDECLNWILSFDGEEKVGRYRIEKDGILIETEKQRYK
jgi:hypothetical protein